MGACGGKDDGKTNNKNLRTSHRKPDSVAKDDMSKDSPSAAPAEQPAEVSPRLVVSGSTYNAWQDSDVVGLTKRVLKDEQLSQEEAFRLIQVIAYKAAEQIETGSPKFTVEDSAVAYTVVQAQCTKGANKNVEGQFYAFYGGLSVMKVLPSN